MERTRPAQWLITYRSTGLPHVGLGFGPAPEIPILEDFRAIVLVSSRLSPEDRN